MSALLGVFALGTLSACGIKGDLKTPPPLWGDKAKVEKSKQEPSKP
jgi:predicted small lipoprotein YifL